MYHMENTPLLLPLNTQRKKMDGWKILCVQYCAKALCHPSFLDILFPKSQTFW